MPLLDSVIQRATQQFGQHLIFLPRLNSCLHANVIFSFQEAQHLEAQILGQSVPSTSMLTQSFHGLKHGGKLLRSVLAKYTAAIAGTRKLVQKQIIFVTFVA